MPFFIITPAGSGEYVRTQPVTDGEGKLTAERGSRCAVAKVPSGTPGSVAAGNLGMLMREHHLAAAPLPVRPAVALRSALAALRSHLTPAQLAELWYPFREPVETALADAEAGVPHALDAVQELVRTLPFVAGRDDGIKAAVAALLG